MNIIPSLHRHWLLMTQLVTLFEYDFFLISSNLVSSYLLHVWILQTRKFSNTSHVYRVAGQTDLYAVDKSRNALETRKSIKISFIEDKNSWRDSKMKIKKNLINIRKLKISFHLFQHFSSKNIQKFYDKLNKIAIKFPNSDQKI